MFSGQKFSMFRNPFLSVVVVLENQRSFVLTRRLHDRDDFLKSFDADIAPSLLVSIPSPSLKDQRLWCINIDDYRFGVHAVGNTSRVVTFVPSEAP